MTKMLALENAEEVLQILDRYTKQKAKEIPPELEEYLNYVAKTGDTVYHWPTVQYLFREKLISVIKDFHDTTPSIEDLPQCPNVDQFNYESLKSTLLERVELFRAAPFTIQRLCELLIDPKKHYSRLDKFMRALEKNILVVSTVEPGCKRTDPEENGDDIGLNGDILSDINIEMDVKHDILKLAEGHIDIDVVATKDEPIAVAMESEAGSSTATVPQSNGNGTSHSDIPPVEMAIEAEEHIDIEKIGKSDETPIASEVTPAAAVAVVAVVPEAASPSKVDGSAITKEDVPLDKVSKESTAETADKLPVVEKPAETAPPTDVPVVESVVTAKDATETVAVVEAIAETKVANNVTESSPIVEEKAAKTDDTVDAKSTNVEAISVDQKPIVEKPTSIVKPQPAVEELPKTPTEKQKREKDDDEEVDVSNAKKIRLEADPIDELPVADKPVDAAAEQIPVPAAAVENIADTPIITETEPIPVIAESDNSSSVKPIDVASTAVQSAAPIVEKTEHPVGAGVSPEAPVTAVVNQIQCPGFFTGIKVDLAEVAATEADLNAIEESIGGAKNAATAAEPVAIAEPIASDPVEPPVAVVAEPIVQESMAVEDAEIASINPSVGNDSETAMESAPIKQDDEKMDVDESNSTDPMDL